MSSPTNVVPTKQKGLTKNKAWLVARREYLENIKTKTFWLGILLVPVLIILATIVPIWLEMSKKARTYAVVDHSGWLLQAVEERASRQDLEAALKAALERVRLAPAAALTLPEAMRAPAEELAKALPAGDLVKTAMEGMAAARGLAGARSLEERVVESLASLAVHGTASEPLGEQLPADVAGRLTALAAPLGRFWKEAPAAEVAKLLPISSRSRFTRKPVPGATEAELAELNRQVGADEIFGYFVLSADPVASAEPSRYVSRNLTDRELFEWFTRLANDEVRDRRLAEKQIDPAVARWVQEKVPFETQKVGAGGEASEVKPKDMVRQWAPVGFVYLLWIAIMSIVQMLLNNTIEEKSNRILEVLLSSVSPVELMAGKILGITATGLTMIGTWMLFLVGVVSIALSLVGDRIDLGLASVITDPLFLGSFVVYFVLGYLFFAALIVGVGSVCNTLKEAQNLMMPIMMLMMVPLLTMMPVGKDPNSTMAKVLSFIPPFTPFVMMNRAAGPPALWEYLATTVLMVVSVALALWGAAKIFRIGILMTGKPPKLGEMLRWLKAPVGQVPDRPGA